MRNVFKDLLSPPRQRFQLYLLIIHVINILIINLTGFIVRDFWLTHIKDDEMDIDYVEESILTFQMCGSALEIYSISHRKDISFNPIIYSAVSFCLSLYWQSLNLNAKGTANYYLERVVICGDKFSSIFLIISSQLIAGHFAWLYDCILRSFEGIKVTNDTCHPDLNFLYSVKTTLMQSSVQFVDSLNIHLAADYFLCRNIVWKAGLETLLGCINSALTGGFSNPNMATVVHYECFGVNDNGIKHFVTFIIHYWFGSLFGSVMAHHFYHTFIDT
uniref:Aquaporin n=1 Tax=Strigamia maritima TaxID=126957 RepID=T1J8J2_STRMM